MLEEEGQVVETISFEQFKQALLGEEIHGTPIGTAYPIPKREKVAGQELLKRRVRLSFEFDVSCNDGPIINLHDPVGTIQDRALLTSFLVADQDRLQDMLMYCAAIELGLDSPETFIELFVQHSTLAQHLFRPAIDTLTGNAGNYWRAVRVTEDHQWGSVLSLATEDLFDCFKAEFVKSDFAVVSE
jgi:hypothetical protein